MADKILNSFDVWITAQGVKSKGRLKSVDNISLEGIERLRELILDFAVSGKLLNQDNSDEPVEVTLKRLRDSAEWKQGALPKIDEKEKLYQLPHNWTWERFGNVLDFTGGSQPPKSTFIEEQLPGYVQLIQIRDLGPNPKPIYVPVEMVTKFCTSNDIMIGRYGASVGKVFWGKEGAYNVALVKLIDEYKIFNSNFLFNLMLSPIGQKLFLGISRSAQDGFSKKDIESKLIPIPPLAEQHRIVAKVDELMALCDALEKQETQHLKSHQLLVETLLGTLTRAADAKEFQHAWNKLYKHFDDLFTTEDSIDQLKQTILQLAVMGKLVPQNPNDEPASELLKRIAKEKERLVEEGVIKKEKALPDIQDSEIPFKVPSSWAFARLGEITNKIGSGSTPRGGRESYSDEGILFLRSQNIYNYGLELSDVAFISNETHERMSGTKVFPGDILLNITGGSLGRSTIFPSDVGEANVSQHVTIIRPTNSQTRFFLHLCIMSPYGQELIWGRQVGANREGLSKRILELFEFPIPPLEEQDRIVSKVDELFALCDRLKARIAEAQKVANQMAEGVVV